MSIQSSILLLLLISAYMHACNGRPLSKHSRKHHHHPAKAVMRNPSEVKKTSISKEFKIGDIQEKPSDPMIVTKQVGQEMKRMKNNPSVSFRVPRKKQQGNEVKKPFDEDLQQSNIIDEGTKMRGRSLLGLETQKTEENINAKETGVVEDVVAMDYEPPHRKPPIHN
ncbi:hypothetical protein ACHQM5_001371 [Ranunculus cassubicifolius]